jgi:hypothetical protein
LLLVADRHSRLTLLAAAQLVLTNTTGDSTPCPPAENGWRAIAVAGLRDPALRPCRRLLVGRTVSI